MSELTSEMIEEAETDARLAEWKRQQRAARLANWGLIAVLLGCLAFWAVSSGRFGIAPICESRSVKP